MKDKRKNKYKYWKTFDGKRLIIHRRKRKEVITMAKKPTKKKGKKGGKK